MKDFFYGIENLFDNFLFLPLDALRKLQLDSWWAANIISWILILIGMVAFVYWMLQLKGHAERKEENKSITSHSYL